MCAVSGVLVLALPIPIVVDNFADYYKEQKQIEAKEMKRDAQAKLQAEEDECSKVINEGLLETIREHYNSTTSFEDVDWASLVVRNEQPVKILKAIEN